jgi:hypothetical protein
MSMDSIVLTGMVSLFCGKISDQDNIKQACSSSIEAASRQSGVYENIKREEQRLTRNAEDKIKEYIGPTTIQVFSTTFLIGRLAMGYNTSFRLGKGPLNGQVVVETDTKQYALKIGWDL